MGSRPNERSTTVKAGAGVGQGGPRSETQQLHLDFWTQFRRYLEDRGSPVRVRKPSTDHWNLFRIARPHFALGAANKLRDGFCDAYLSITGPHAKEHFRLLRRQHEAQVAAALAPLGTVHWLERPDRRESQIILRRAAAPADRATWPELNDWLARALETMRDLFVPIIGALPADRPPSR